MRWPLRNQVLLPATCLMLATLIAVSTFNAWISARRARLRIELELNEVAKTLADASFPLTDGVLQKMRGLSGAEFVVTNRGGKIVASSSPKEFFTGLVPQAESRSQPMMTFGTPTTFDGGRFFQATLDVRRMGVTDSPATLHILYPEDSYHEAWRHAVYPPLLVGAVAILLVVALGSGIASRVTRPLRRLQIQVDEIAHGEFQSMPIPSRDDEIADIPVPVQVKLLRALEQGEVLPVGSGEAIKSNFRIVSATHRDLLEKVRSGEFRHDLYFRLGAFRVEMPPLRERQDDICELAEHFLSEGLVLPDSIVEIEIVR